MNVYLPEPLFFIIYSYVGHNSLYLNKYYYIFLIGRRKEFVDKPLKISYRLCKWKQKQYDIENNYSRKMRPCMKVDTESIIDISGGRVFGDSVLSKCASTRYEVARAGSSIGRGNSSASKV